MASGGVTVTITDAGAPSSLAVGNYVTLTSTVSVNGVQFTGGNYRITSVPSSTSFTVTFASAASGTGTGTGTVTGIDISTGTKTSSSTVQTT